MKSYRLLLVIGCLAVLTSLGASQESGTVIQVNCTQDFGCLHLLGQAIEAAPEGATIQLGSGVFYELRGIIDKSLTIRGTRGSDPAAILTLINAVEPGTLFTIQAANHPVNVILEDLLIQSSVVSIAPFIKAMGNGLSIQGSSEGNPDQLKVIFRNSALTTVGTAINTHGKAQLALQSNEIKSASLVLYSQDGSELIVQDNEIFVLADYGLSGLSVVFLREVDARFERNLISQDPERKLAGISALGGRYSFIENRVEGHAAGVILGGKVVADFQRNLFSENVVGLVLQAPPCAQDPAPEIRFEGFITGSENQFTYNSKADLCPALNEFPWPPGFTTP